MNTLATTSCSIFTLRHRTAGSISPVGDIKSADLPSKPPGQSAKKIRIRGYVFTIMAESTRLRLTDRRERRLNRLEDATGENTRAGAIDAAANYYLRMAGGTAAKPTGAVEELMRTAIEQGSVTPTEIAEILDTDELPVEYTHEWSVGDD